MGENLIFNWGGRNGNKISWRTTVTEVDQTPLYKTGLISCGDRHLEQKKAYPKARVDRKTDERGNQRKGARRIGIKIGW